MVKKNDKCIIVVGNFAWKFFLIASCLLNASSVDRDIFDLQLKGALLFFSNYDTD